MRVVIVFDSVFGNTEQIARAMAEPLGARAQVQMLRAGEAHPEELKGADLLVAGSPTSGFRPTPELGAFLEKARRPGLQQLAVAAFDTRLSAEQAKSWAMRWLLRTGGYAGKRIGEQLQKAGGRLVAPPEGFVVTAEKGPLAPGELERAAAWALGLFEGARFAQS